MKGNDEIVKELLAGHLRRDRRCVNVCGLVLAMIVIPFLEPFIYFASQIPKGGSTLVVIMMGSFGGLLVIIFLCCLWLPMRFAETRLERIRKKYDPSACIVWKLDGNEWMKLVTLSCDAVHHILCFFYLP